MNASIKQAYWFLCGDLDIASARLQGYLIHEGLLGLGLRSNIIYAPKIGFSHGFPPFVPPPYNIDLRGAVSIIQKLKGGGTKTLMGWLKRCGSRVIYINCDLDEQDDSWVEADAVLVTSAALRQYYVVHGQTVDVVPEPYEYALSPDRVEREHGAKPRKIVWFGHCDNWHTVLRWKRIIESEFSDKYTIVTCSNHPDANIRWSRDNVRNLLSEADVALLPTLDTPEFSVKSPNRLVQCMAMGVTAVVGPLDAYQQLETLGLPVLLARTDDEFRSHLSKLHDDAFRQANARQGFDGVTLLYSFDKVMHSWVEALGIDRCQVSRSRHWFSATAILTAMLWSGRVIGGARRRIARLVEYPRGMGQ
jgi:hypothetical protein